MQKKIVILVALFCIAVGAGLLLSKHSSTLNNFGANLGPAKTPYTSPLMKFVPASAVSVNDCSITSPGAKRLQQSDFVKAFKVFLQPGKIRELALKYLPGDRPPEAEKMLDTIQRIVDVFAKSDWKVESAGDYIMYQTAQLPGQAIPGITSLSVLNDQTSYLKIIDGLRSVGLPIEEQTEAGVKIYEVRLDNLIGAVIGDKPLPKELSELQIKMTFAVHNGMAIASTDRDAVLRFVRNEGEATPLDFKSLPFAQTALQKLPYDNATTYCYQYTDIEKYLAPHLSKAREALAKESQSFNAETRTLLLSYIDHLPISALVRTDGFDIGLVSESILILQNKEHAPKLHTMLGNARSNATVGSLRALPAGALLVFGFSGKLFQAAHEYISDPKILALLDSIADFSLALNYVVGEELFPSLTISASANNPDELAKQIEDGGNLLIGMTKAPLSGWLDKTVEDTAIKYNASPLGVGIFMAKRPNGLVLSSSEVGIRRAILVASAKAPSFVDDAECLQHVNSKNAVGYFHINFSGVGHALQGATTTMAAMAPGKMLSWPEEIIQLLDTFGSFSTSVMIEDDVIRMRTSQRSAGNPGKS